MEPIKNKQIQNQSNTEPVKNKKIQTQPNTEQANTETIKYRNNQEQENTEPIKYRTSQEQGQRPHALGHNDLCLPVSKAIVAPPIKCFRLSNSDRKQLILTSFDCLNKVICKKIYCELLDKIQRRVCNVIRADMASLLQSLSYRCGVASL